MLSLQWPWLLVLLPLPLMVWRWWAPAQQTRAALFMPLIDGNSVSASTAPGRPALLSLLLLGLCWLLLVLAAARPVHIGQPLELPGKGRDLFLAVDISGSMNIEDMVLNQRRVDRLTMVKSVLGDFIRQRQGDRLGLIVFGSHAYVQAPLTFDLLTVSRLLQETQIGFAGQQTAIGDAIGLAIKRLADNPVEHRTLILLTDGANNAGTLDPRQASDLAASQGIVIHTIAFGGDPASGGLFGFSMRRNSSDIDEAGLQAIAEATGGRFFRARNHQELVDIYHTLDQLARREQEAAVFRPTMALFYLPLAGAMLCFLLFIASRRLAGAAQ